MTTGRINQVATLSRPLPRSQDPLFSETSARVATAAPASRWECLGIGSSSQITQQAVVQRLTSFPRIPIEPSFALNQRSENE
jgi:hypothetical protein